MEDTALPIFKRLFLVRTPNLASLDEDYIRRYGVPVTGIEDIDRQWADELVWRYLTINDMIEYYRKGVDIYVQDRKDTKIIYDLIYAHLESFSEFIGHSINATNVPMDDLEDLAAFASLIYPYAKQQPSFQKLRENLYLKQISGDHEGKGKLNPVLGDAANLFRKVPRSVEQTEKQKLAERLRNGEELEETEMPHDKLLSIIQNDGFSTRRKTWR